MSSVFPTPGTSRPVNPIAVEWLYGRMNAETDLVAEALIPPTPVVAPGGSGTYMTLANGSMFGVNRRLDWADGSHAPLLAGAELSGGTFQAARYGNRVRVSDLALADSLVPGGFEALQLAYITRAARVEQERRTADIFTAGNSGAGTKTIAAGSEYDVSAAADPIGDIKTGAYAVRDACGMMPNVCVMGIDAWEALMDNDAVVERLSHHSNRHGVTRDGFAAVLRDLFGIERLVVGAASRNQSEPGVAASLTNIWSDNIHLVRIEAGASANVGQVSLGNTFAARIEVAPWTFDGYREEGELADYLRAYKREALEVIDTGCLYTILNAKG